MANEIRYRAGTSTNFANLTPQEGTYYYLTDTGDLYFGSKKVTNDSDVEQVRTLLQNLSTLVGEIPEGSESTDLVSYIAEANYNPTDVNNPEKCLIIPEKAFYQSNANELDFQYALKVDYKAFAESMSLRQVLLPSVKTICDKAFYGCASLTSCDYPFLTYVGEYAFYLCSNLTNFNARMIKSIGKYAFQGTRISKIDFPHLEVIGDSAFKDNMHITELNIPSAIEIGNNSFEALINITSVDLMNVVSIGDYAFANCSKLESVYVYSSNIPKIGEGTFDDEADNFKIYVRGELVALFRQAWSAYADKIVAIPGTEMSSGSGLPTVDSNDAGKVMMVNEEGNWVAKIPENLVTWIEM